MRKIEEKDKWDSLDPLEFEQVSDHAKNFWKHRTYYMK